MERMRVQRMAEGLWRWTAPHPEWRDGAGWDRTVGSVYCETPDAVVLIDPLIPDDGADRERFWDALDRDVERLRVPVVVLLTCRWHVRGAGTVRRRYAAAVWAPPNAVDGLEGLDGALVLGNEARPVAGVETHLMGLPSPTGDEAVFWLSEYRALVPGDVLLGDGAGGVRLAPPEWYSDSPAERHWYGEELVPGLHRFAARDLSMLLVSHGEPVVHGASAALRAALAAP
jgi:hypothetical protein